MLVLSRKAGESLVIDRHIRVAITRIQGNRVTLAIEAPEDIKVLRGELVFDDPQIEALPPRHKPCPTGLSPVQNLSDERMLAFNEPSTASGTTGKYECKSDAMRSRTSPYRNTVATSQ